MKKSELKQIIKEEIRNVLAEATWTKQKIEKELRDLNIGANEEGGLDDSMAYDIASDWVNGQPGLKDAIKKYYGVSDVIGFVADRIA